MASNPGSGDQRDRSEKGAPLRAVPAGLRRLLTGGTSDGSPRSDWLASLRGSALKIPGVDGKLAALG